MKISSFFPLLFKKPPFLALQKKESKKGVGARSKARRESTPSSNLTIS
jgi:hypothetical protein